MEQRGAARIGIAQRPAPLRPGNAAIGVFGRCDVAQGTMWPGVVVIVGGMVGKSR